MVDVLKCDSSDGLMDYEVFQLVTICDQLKLLKQHDNETVTICHGLKSGYFVQLSTICRQLVTVRDNLSRTENLFMWAVVRQNRTTEICG